MNNFLLQPNHPASRKSLKLLRDLVERRTGIYYSDLQLDLLAGKMAPRASDLGMNSFLDYYYLLKYDSEGAGEWATLESSVTVNETYFWRDPEPLQMAVKTLFPQLQAKLTRPLRIWHAACASGEEPFSMAMLLHQERLCCPGSVEILATDINLRVLEMARRGVYRDRSLRCLPDHLRERYFKVDATGNYEFDAQLRCLVKFQALNLVDPEALAELRDIDLIFCRNVLTYFRDPTIASLARSFYGILSSPGHLFLGSCDSFLRKNTPFHFSEIAGQISYQKTTRTSQPWLG